MRDGRLIFCHSDMLGMGGFQFERAIFVSIVWFLCLLKVTFFLIVIIVNLSFYDSQVDFFFFGSK